jgi:hypothetical protein
MEDYETHPDSDGSSCFDIPADYSGYMNITVNSGENFDIDGVEVTNNTDKDFHIFCKLITPESIDVDFEIQSEEASDEGE